MDVSPLTMRRETKQKDLYSHRGLPTKAQESIPDASSATLNFCRLYGLPIPQL